jgi:hypothetical protein
VILDLFNRRICATLLCLSAGTASAAEPGWDIQLELGATFQQKNDVQIPNDDDGTKFALDDISGSGPWGTVRADINWNIDEKHGMRFVLSPFSYSETGSLDEPVRFAGEEYAPDEHIRASYRFNSWRVGYRYNFMDREDWRLWVGGTLKIRDAEIKLSQQGVSSNDDDLGVVPLLYLAAEYQINPQWLLQADFDGLAGGPGRAFDISARIAYRPDDKWTVGLGYRGLEGGVDSDDVYNFAWFNTAFTSVAYRF